MFKGFTGETIDFLWGIRLNNNREWFEAHKEIYLAELYRPMVEMADELCEYLRSLRPDHGLARKVTRIYRDTRRLVLRPGGFGIAAVHGKAPRPDGAGPKAFGKFGSRVRAAGGVCTGASAVQAVKGRGPFQAACALVSGSEFQHRLQE